MCRLSCRWAVRKTETPCRAGILPLLLAIAGLGPGGGAAGTWAQDGTTSDPQRWEQAIAAFEASDQRQAPPTGEIVFVGSSSIRLWDVEHCFPNTTSIINRGFGGSEVSDAVHFAHRIVTPYLPRVVVMYAGDNDIQGGKTPQQVAEDFQRFCTVLHQQTPSARLVYISIKPSLQRWALVDKMREANRLIHQICEQDLRRVFVDIDAPMIGPDGKPRAELFVDDGLHLSKDGYALWSRIVQPFLNTDDRERAAAAFTAHRFDSPQASLPYRLLAPRTVEDGVTYPLVIFLHGAGERGDDNSKQLVHGMPEFASDWVAQRYPCFVVALQCPEERQWVDAPWATSQHQMPAQPTRELQAVMALVEQLKQRLPVDPDRVYITGLSMGGFGCWDALSRWPEAFAAAAPICGGCDLSRAESLRRMPLWIAHGQVDDSVPVELSRNMVQALRAAGGQPRYDEYADVGHDAWSRLYNNPEFYPWLFAQRRPPVRP